MCAKKKLIWSNIHIPNIKVHHKLFNFVVIDFQVIANILGDS